MWYLLLDSFFPRVPSTMSTQAPTFTQPLQSVVALEGSAATFEAQVSGKHRRKKYIHTACFGINKGLPEPY